MGAVEFTAQRGLLLQGDEKGAWLADTTEETITGSELVTDGDMPNTSNWVPSNATLSIVAGKLRVTCSADGSFSVAQSVTPSSGDNMLLVYDIDTTGMSGNTFVDITGMDQQLHGFGVAITNPVTYVSDGIGSLSFLGSSQSLTGDYFDIDNVSLRLAVPDLSANNNGLAVHGSITKSAVATGADLVAYSGFSASNYLEQPYNSDFDFGTGDFTVCGWLQQTSAIKSTQNPIQLGQSATYSINILRETSTGDKILQFLVDGATTSTGVINSSKNMVNDEWVFVVLSRLNGTFYFYVDGVLSATDSTNVGALTPALTDTTIIGYGDLSISSVSEISVALPRVLDYALTAAQIKADYDSEKNQFKKYSYYTQLGESYSLDIPQKTPRPSTSTQKNDTKTISGKMRSIIHHESNEWEIATSLIHRTDGTDFPRKSEFAELMYSTRGSEQFTYDPYGSVASPDDPLTVMRVSNQYDMEPEENTDLFRSGFRVREIE